MKLGFFDKLARLFELTRRVPKENREKNYWSVFVDGEFLTVMYARRDTVLDYVKEVLAGEIDQIDDEHYSVLCVRSKAITIPDAKITQQKE